VVVWSALFAAMLRFATPLLFAALGGVISERSGVINIGLEGMMLMGAFWGIWGADQTGSWVLGLIIGMGSGLVLALIHAVWSITLRADQIVSGFSMNFLALGITGFFYVNIYGTQGTPEGVPRAPDVNLPGIEDIPFFGDIFGQLNVLVWLGLITVFLLWLYLFRTPSGLRLRSVGENPLAAETAGLSPVRIRYRAVAISGALAAIGGAYLSIGQSSLFTRNMSAGRGYIALAALIFGKWRPVQTMLACLLFGLAEAVSIQMQGVTPIPVEFILPWDDAEIDRESGFALFDAFASKEKTLHANPGGHHEVPWFETEISGHFFARHLGRSVPSPA